jgi:hypothetical protein
MGKMTHDDAEKKLKDAGITTGGKCHDRSKSDCTSFEQINQGTVDGLIAFKKNSKGEIHITGGTETGHADGTKSHGNGYKVDLRPNPTIDDYIKNTYTDSGLRAGDSAQMYTDTAGNIVFAREGDHWDITFSNP